MVTARTAIVIARGRARLPHQRDRLAQKRLRIHLLRFSRGEQEVKKTPAALNRLVNFTFDWCSGARSRRCRHRSMSSWVRVKA